MEGLKPEQLHGIYRDIAENLGVDVAMLMFEHYRGLQVTFPTRFLCPEYIKSCICTEYNGNNTSELAKKYNYSGRWVRELVAREKQKNISTTSETNQNGSTQDQMVRAVSRPIKEGEV